MTKVTVPTDTPATDDELLSKVAQATVGSPNRENALAELEYRMATRSISATT